MYSRDGVVHCSLDDAWHAWSSVWKELGRDVLVRPRVKHERYWTVQFLIWEPGHNSGGVQGDGSICRTPASFGPSYIPPSPALKGHSHEWVTDGSIQVRSKDF